MYQVYALPIKNKEDVRLVTKGQLVFRSNESNEIVGIIRNILTDDEEKEFFVEIYLFEQSNDYDLVYLNGGWIISQELSEDEQMDIFQDMENTYPGYVEWLVNMNCDDWREGCPIK
jgi:hypothetical protein